jgi:hypothetical protein
MSFAIYSVMKWLNIAGLTIDIIGALIMYWKTPHPSRKPEFIGGASMISKSARYLLIDKDQDKIDSNVLRFGIGLIVLGFVLQLIAEMYH